MYLKPACPEKTWVLDIETDDLDATVIWCVCVKNIKTEEELTFTDRKDFYRWYDGTFTLIGNNALSFDIPVINRIWDMRISLLSVIDTLVLSYLYNPAIDGGHSLEAWGYRLDFPKGGHSDWSRFSPEMLSYCKQDVHLTYKLYFALTKKMLHLGYSELSAEIEHKTRILIDEQQKNGFWFDIVGGTRLRDELKQLQSDLAKDLRKLFPPRRTKVAEYTFRRRADGSPFASYEKHRDKYHDVILDEDTGVYECFDLVPFNIGSPQQRIKHLLELGWEPTEFTKAGNPKVNEDEILKFAESVKRPELKALAEWIVLAARISMLSGNPVTKTKGWLGHVVDHGNGDTRIHGKVMSCGAASRRMIHSAPNSANVPSPHKAKYGKEMRGLWGVQPGKGLTEVGVDASGLENVGLLHYLSDKYRDKAAFVLNQPKPNDIHSMNSRKLTQALGRPVDREWGAKTGYYAALYGAYPKKLGEIVKGSVQDGEVVQSVLLSSVPGLLALNNDCQDEWKRSDGRIRTIDGGSVICPGMSAALNYRVQSLGAIVMKLSAILLREEADSIGLWFRTVGTIHDEFQLECKEEDGERLGKLAVSCITKAAERLGFKILLTGEYKLGKNWAECH